MKVTVTLGRSVKRIEIDQETLKTEEHRPGPRRRVRRDQPGHRAGRQADGGRDREGHRRREDPRDGLSRARRRREPEGPAPREAAVAPPRRRREDGAALRALAADGRRGALARARRGARGAARRAGPVRAVRQRRRDPRRAARCATSARDTKRDAKVLVRRRARARPHGDRAGRRRCAGATSCSGKLLSPLEGIGPGGPADRRSSSSASASDGVTEVIVATPPSVDGEATALLLKRELAPLGVAITRIASGVPHGGDLEFADPITMGRALAGPPARCRLRPHDMDRDPSPPRTPPPPSARTRRPCAPAGSSSSAGRSRSTRRRASSSRATSRRRPSACWRTSARPAAGGLRVRRRRADDDLPRRPRALRASTRSTARFFAAPYPARATVQVAALPRGARVEIDAIASTPRLTLPARGCSTCTSRAPRSGVRGSSRSSARASRP